MPPLIDTLVGRLTLNAVLDILVTAVFVYALFSLIRGTRAVTLVIGVSVLLGIYGVARALDLELFTRILEAGAFVGVFALVVVFQPELRRVLERIGRVGSFGWLLMPSEQRTADHVASEVARAAGALSSEGHGALIVIERETGLEEIAETGVMLHADLTADLLSTIFMPKTALHDGAVIVREDRIVAAGALLPLTEMSIGSERYGTRHRAALGITEQTDAVVVVVSEESGQMSLVERARIVRVPSEAQLSRALRALLEAPGRSGRFLPGGRGGSDADRPGGGVGGVGGGRSGPLVRLRRGDAAAERTATDRAPESVESGPAAAAARAPQ